MHSFPDIFSLSAFYSNILTLGFVGILLLLLSSVIANNTARLLASIICGLFIILQTISLYFTQSFIGYQFLVHLNLRGMEGMVGLYYVQIVVGLLLLTLFILVLYSARTIVCANRYFGQFRSKHRATLTSLYFLSLIGILISIGKIGRFYDDASTLYATLDKQTAEFDVALNRLDIHDYVMPDQIEATRGKNIIVISLESLERAYLSEKLSHLTPNLQRLKADWNYLELEQNLGSGWTSGSLYTYLTGFPAFFGVSGNSIFQTAYHSGISSISHTLDKAGYHVTYMSGNANHSGVKELLHTFQFDNVIDKYNAGDSSAESTYGIRDKDLFELARNQIDRGLNSNEPFALFISTTDTHFPDGIYDDRMEGLVSENSNQLEFMVSAVDHMVGEFVRYLEDRGILAETAVYIFPDHLKMGNDTMFGETGDRGLYVITNTESMSATDTSALYQIDLPNIILGGAEVEHNQKFLTDHIAGDKNTFIKENLRELTALNTSGLLRVESKPIVSTSTISPHYQEYSKDVQRYIAHAGGKIDNHTYTNSLEALDLSYSKGFRLFELDFIRTSDNKYVAAHDWKHWSEIANYSGIIPVREDEFLNYKIQGKYTAMGMDLINEWFANHPDAILVTDKVNDPKRFASEFIAPERLMMELFDLNAVKEGLAAGILSAMPSQRVLERISKDMVGFLLDLGVKDIAISYRYIAPNRPLIQELKKSGINVFAFHINHDAGVDEDYMTKFEFDDIFGIYADTWNFN